ncbi:MAG: LLM class flavin-dependent oxidoreductase, partial [Proteobacteria bacterium]|nr:LLM class flavin-dependent oxidoreductase [Pseudomonadota bacterium]
MRILNQDVMRSDFGAILDRTRAAERAGFDAVLVPDHFLGNEDGIAESWATLAALAAATERIRLGGAVMCNLFRHPCLTAQIAATVDRISGGRLELGLGAGWMDEEFRRTGIPFPRPGERIEMLGEALEIVLPALEGREVSFAGAHYRVEEFSLRPGPVQKPRPPLHIGGGGDRLLRLAARHADVVSLVPPTRR